jgi:hypothetical protein
MNKIVLIIGFLLSASIVIAQNELTPKERIMQVMQSEEDYLYADQTSATAEQALERAQSILMQEVESYLKESGEDVEIIKGIVTEQMVTITIQRGDKYRAFVYVDKSNLGVEKTMNSLNETVELNLNDSVAVLHEENVESAETDSVQTDESAITQIEYDDILVKIEGMTSRLQVYDYIQLLKKEGESISFYEHPTINEQMEMYLVLYRRGGKIAAVLTPPDTQGIRHNLTTGEPDSKSNYPATSVNGFIFEP